MFNHIFVPLDGSSRVERALLVAAVVIVGATVLGLVGGAIGGWLVGALTGFGIEATQARRYAAGVEEGHILVPIQSPPERVGMAAEILRRGYVLEVDVTGAEMPAVTISSTASAIAVPR